jgi:hypothetical protein
MTNSEFYTLMDRMFNDARNIAKVKGNDYTKGSNDALANFKEGGKDIDIDPIKVCWIFMNKHYQAITNYVKTNGQSESEPISERIKDLINYLVLMQAIVVEKETMKIKESVDLPPSGDVIEVKDTNF